MQCSLKAVRKHCKLAGFTMLEEALLSIVMQLGLSHEICQHDSRPSAQHTRALQEQRHADCVSTEYVGQVVSRRSVGMIPNADQGQEHREARRRCRGLGADKSLFSLNPQRAPQQDAKPQAD